MAHIEQMGKLTLETPSGKWVVVSEEGYLLRSIDAWGKEKPVFVEKDFAMRFTKNQALQQVSFLGWHPHKIRAKAVKVR